MFLIWSDQKKTKKTSEVKKNPPDQWKSDLVFTFVPFTCCKGEGEGWRNHFCSEGDRKEERGREQTRGTHSLWEENLGWGSFPVYSQVTLAFTS